MRHLGLAVGHMRDIHGNDNDQSVEVNFGVQPAPDSELGGYNSEPEIDGNEENGDNEEDQEEDSEEEDNTDDEETGRDDEEHEGSEARDEEDSDNGYDEL